VRPTDRIPAFAICARCGARRRLGACASCGILVCGDCRGERDCAVCFGERCAAAEQQRRRARLRQLGRRAAVVAMVAASGVTGLSAAFVPSGPLCTTAVAPMAIDLRAADEAPLGTPVPLEAAPLPLASTPPAWREAERGRIPAERPLTFSCFQARSNLTCCVLELP
jgi:hypothetical protein